MNNSLIIKKDTKSENTLQIFKTIIFNQEMVLLLSILFLLIVVGFINPRYVSNRNLISLFLGNAYIAVAAIGMSMVIISGNIDISVGSLIGVLATISGTIAEAGFPIWISWTIPLAIGMFINFVMGILVAYFRLPSIVVSLGFMSILKGGLIMFTGGAWISNLPDGYALSQLRPLGIPMPIYFMVILTTLTAYWMKMSPLGRSFYAVGGNSEAARLAGIQPKLTVLKVFILHGFFVGIASVLFSTQLSVIQSTVPPYLELTIITASVVGGVSILGGTGTVIGSTLAAVLLAAISSSMIFVNLSPFWLRSAQGLLILATVLADLYRRQRQLNK
jgi:ribose/xylose/arabinose/galactoside ABC-type transport system permease subunit